jgi:CelD/BcsL family acetyltransferase involved in cellulose biosynthesis
VPLAAQMWVVRATWAAVLKLAHDENAKALSPGTVLTAAMTRTLIEQDGVTELDFGRGDDDYKAAWTGARRQRVGVVLANPWRAAGAAAIVRRRVRDFVKGTT